MKKLHNYLFTLLLVIGVVTMLYPQNSRGLVTPFPGDPIFLRATPNLNLLEMPGDELDLNASMILGADYLKQMQADITEDNAGNGTGLTESPNDPDDGGWDWRVTSPPAPFFHTTTASPKNLYGATALGLYYSYLETNDPSYLTAMTDAADIMVADVNIRSGADMVFLMLYDDLPVVTGTTYMNAAKSKYDGRIITYGTATGLAQYIRDARAGQGYENGIIGWDVGIYAVIAQMLNDRFTGEGYDEDADDIAEVLWLDSFNDNPGYFDVVDDAGWDPTYTNLNYYWYTLGITGLIDAFRAANVHTDEIPGLVGRLQASQYSNSGAFSYSYGANPNDEDWQSTAYTVKTLYDLNPEAYMTEINLAANFIGSTQDLSGGWLYSNFNHYPEIAGENTTALHFGKETANVNVTNQVYNFPIADVTIEFSTLPSGGGDVTVRRFNMAPTGYPGLPAGATHAGLYLVITSEMANYSFDAEITVDVTGLGFDGNESVMYFNSATNTWVAVTGSYSAPYFTFTTNHFTPFTFINTPATAYDVYLSSDPVNLDGNIYPNINWGMPNPLPPGYPGTPANDWGFTPADSIILYIVPEIGSVFAATDITIQWDNSKFQYGRVDKSGGIFDGPTYFFSTLPTVNQVTINAARNENVLPITSGQFIAKLKLKLLKPGFGPINFTALDFRAFDGIGGQLGVYVTGNNAEVKSYLGDVASSIDTLFTGDGLIDFDDLSPWAGSYWSGVGSVGMENYKVKYDIGPTSDHSVYGLPTTDAKIQFEDLVIFSMSYGLSASNVYPKIEAEPTEPVELQLAEPIVNGNQTRIPLYVSGGVQNVRAMSLTLTNQFGKLVSVEKGSILSEFENPVMLMHNSDGKQVYVDLAVFGAEETGINSEGEVLILVFEGTTELDLNSADIRNIFNKPMEVNISGIEGLVPAEFALLQNYPNPFNPTTTINYELPEQAMVEISIFNALGERVVTLVNEMKDAGRYSVAFNAANYSSGIYFYQIKANDFVSVKKMILMK